MFKTNQWPLKKTKSDAALNLKMTLRTAKTTLKKRWWGNGQFLFRNRQQRFLFSAASIIL
jgi:hypothetical protein